MSGAIKLSLYAQNVAALALEDAEADLVRSIERFGWTAAKQRRLSALRVALARLDEQVSPEFALREARRRAGFGSAAVAS